MSANQGVSIASTSALQASSYATDSTAPQLVSFSISLNGAAHVRLTFSETILASAVQPHLYTLQNSVPPTTTSYTLTGGSPTSLSETEVMITPSLSDFNAITALEGLARGTASSYLSVTAGGASDSSGNAVVAIASANALQATSYQADTGAPEIIAFRLDLNSDRVSIDFSETVRMSDIESSAMTIQSTGSDASVSVALAGSQVTAGSVNSASVQLDLAKLVQDAIRLEPRLGTTRSSTFLSVTSLAARDMFGNRVAAIVPALALQLQLGGYMADATSPSLSSFAVSLGTGVLTINFNEPVNASTLVITELVFKSRGDGSALASQVHTLTGGLLMTRTNALQLVVNLTTADLNAIKAKPSLLEDMSSTFVGISPLFVEDMYGNAVNAEVAKAGLFDPDQTKPILLSFGVDMNQHILSLTFDETMNATSLVPAGLVLQLSSSAGAPGRHRLTGGTLLATLPSTVVQLSLLESDGDANQGKVDCPECGLHVARHGCGQRCGDGWYQPSCAGRQHQCQASGE